MIWAIYLWPAGVLGLLCLLAWLAGWTVAAVGLFGLTCAAVGVGVLLAALGEPTGPRW